MTLSWKLLQEEIVLLQLVRFPHARAYLPIAVDSWPGLCHTLLAFVMSELGKKRPEPSVQRIAKKFFQQCEDSRRSSRPGMLLKRAPRIFTAFQRILSTATLMTPLGQEFGNILRVHLLPVEQYTASATSTAFQGRTSLKDSSFCAKSTLGFCFSVSQKLVSRSRFWRFCKRQSTCE